MKISTGLVSVLSLLAVATPALAQENTDPTFNGLLRGAVCYVKSIVLCEGGYCVPVVAPTFNVIGQIRFHLNDKTYKGEFDKYVPMKDLMVSKAELGKPIWVKFTAKMGDDDFKIWFIGKPQQGGQFEFSAAGTVEVKNLSQIYAMNCQQLGPYD